jgi:hypothetical protein
MKTRQSTRYENLNCLYKRVKGNARATQYEVLSDLKEVLGYKPDLNHHPISADTPRAATRRKFTPIPKQIKFAIDTEYDAILGLATLISDYETAEKGMKDRTEENRNRNVIQIQSEIGYERKENSNCSRQYLLPMGLVMKGKEMFEYREEMDCMYHVSTPQKLHNLPNHKLNRSARHVRIAYYISGTHLIN